MGFSRSNRLAADPLGRTRQRHPRTVLAGTLLIAALTACGGGGGGGGGGGAGTGGGGGGAGGTTLNDFDRNIFQNSNLYKDLCLNPRVGTSDSQGATADENDWLRAWSHDLYLWYDEITDQDPRNFTTPEDFDLMRTFETTPTGADKDRFHFRDR